MIRYRHRFQVRAPLTSVADFHAQSASMAAITPPPVVVRVHQAPNRLDEGDEMEFTLWLGPLPIRWLARIEDVGPTGFVDRQLRGPFGHWVHRHSFVPVDETTTAVVDEISFRLQPHPFWGLVGLGMWLNLPLLFAYRAWRTRQLLETQAGAWPLPEDSDWSGAVQNYLAENPRARAIDIADALGCTEAEVLSVLSDSVWKISKVDLLKVLAEIRTWGDVMVLVRNGDAVAEVEVQAEGGQVSGDWLNWIEAGYNLHIRCAATHHVLALIRPGKRGLTYSFNLVNQAGQVFCRFYTRTPAATARFLTFCQAYQAQP